MFPSGRSRGCGWWRGGIKGETPHPLSEEGCNIGREGTGSSNICQQLLCRQGCKGLMVVLKYQDGRSSLAIILALNEVTLLKELTLLSASELLSHFELYDRLPLGVSFRPCRTLARSMTQTEGACFLRFCMHKLYPTSAAARVNATR